MRTSLTIALVAGLFLFPFPAPAESDIPPVSQPLVREGDFAIELAPLYGLGTPETEAEAEDLLSQAGVLPDNGWISDYPVTPAILHQLQGSAARAAQDGRIWMTPAESERVLFDLADRMGLPVPAGAETPDEAPAVVYQQPVINNYYTGYGPPIITYYAPPSYYGYLYTWVPSPAWWYGYWFPGFYICNTFSTTIVVHSRTVYVRNRFVEPVTKRLVHVVPATVKERSIIRPVLQIRTEDGRHFANMREMRTHWGAPDRREAGKIKVRPSDRRAGYNTPEKRRDAGRIYSNTIQRRDAVRQERSDDSAAVKKEEQRQRRTGREARNVAPPAKYEQRTYTGNSGNSKRAVTAPPEGNGKAERAATPQQQKQYQGTGNNRRVEATGTYVQSQKTVRSEQRSMQKQGHTGRTERSGRRDRGD